MVTRPSRETAGGHLVGNGTERVDVGALVDGALAHRLFGRHVLRRTQRQSRLRHADAPGRLHGEGDPKIGDQCVAVPQHDVFRLYVAMDHA